MSHKKILLYTDDLIFTDKLKKILNSHYYDLILPQNFNSLLLDIENIKPDLLIIDIFSKNFNPLTLLEQIKKDNFLNSQKILIASQNKKIENIIGDVPKVKGYISKPVDFNKLENIVYQNLNIDEKKIFIADDDEEFSDLLKIFLESKGFNIIIENNPLKILEKVKKEKPNIIFLDIIMPKKDGFEIMQELLEDHETKDIPIVIITALNFDSFQDKGSFGFPEIISKEINEKTFMQIIENKLNSIEETEYINKIKQRILIADDQTELLLLVKETIEKAGFEVFIANDGKEAIAQVYETNPDLIILDYNMPIKNGLEVAKELKENPLFAHIPIMIVTSFGEKQAKLQGLSMGIDDYLIKPVDTDELIARIKMILKRNKLILDTNPLSKLPGNPSIQARIEKILSEKKKFAVMYLDLNNFKAYNDIYGFEAGDRVIKTTANLLVKTIMPSENSDNFIGHIGGDDFIITTSFDTAEDLAIKITKNFDEIAPSFYKKEDREKGYITSLDRQGNLKKFPLLAIAIAIVHNGIRDLNSYPEISNIGSELKKAAKVYEKSAYVFDKRKN